MEASLISAQLLKARDSVVEVGRFKFTVRRPTEMERLRRLHRSSGSDMLAALISVQEDVIGWDGVLESDIKAGEPDTPAAFSRVIYAMWIEDRPDLWVPIREHLIKVAQDHEKKIEKLQGN
jgi:hypothetical protein